MSVVHFRPAGGEGTACGLDELGTWNVELVDCDACVDTGAYQAACGETEDRELAADATHGYVENLARRWAGVDPLQRWIHDAPDAAGVDDLAETVADYLGEHDPFPEDMAVEVQLGVGWRAGLVLERLAHDEWAVEVEDVVKFCGSGELRPRGDAPEPIRRRLSQPW